jgi:GntR family negative regulator for fad regulon and positive regulator of fabA
MAWDPPQRPAELAETRIIAAILDGQFPINSTLPPERDLSAQLGVTRPTLREALQRLARDGWLEIRHGRLTRVRDYWQEGSLGVLGALALRRGPLPPDFVPHLLTVRLALAPAYTRLAVERSAPALADLLDAYQAIEDAPEAFAEADWHLHRVLTIASGNPVFTLILNGFAALYHDMARIYFAAAQARTHSRGFYTALLAAVRSSDPESAEILTRRIMQESIELWRRVQPTPGGQTRGAQDRPLP